jgi:predicted TPR repeat methyltransferase
VERARAQDSVDAERLRNEGYALLEAGRFPEAQALLEKARALEPGNALVHYRLALLFADTGRSEQALKSLDTSLALQSDNARAHNNRGTALQMLGRMAEAEQAYRRALELAPDLEQPYTNLGHLLQLQGKAQQAAELYRLAMSRGLDASLFGHELAAVSGSVTDRAPNRWVRATFDNFASKFDDRLRELEYDAPRQLSALVLSHAAGLLDILDLGCGTGQCGLMLAHRKQCLVGVDLSEKMLALARARAIYDDLHPGEIHTWLASSGASCFDVVIAADVFIYIGALEDLFRDAARVLRPGGWFAFSTEECATGKYTLLATGRYAQSRAYITGLAQDSFTLVAADPTIVRKESGVPIAGRLYLLQKRPLAN